MRKIMLGYELKWLKPNLNPVYLFSPPAPFQEMITSNASQSCSCIIINLQNTARSRNNSVSFKYPWRWLLYMHKIVFALFLLKFKCKLKHFQLMTKILCIIKWVSSSWQSSQILLFSERIVNTCSLSTWLNFITKEKCSLSQSLLLKIRFRLCRRLHSLGQLVGGIKLIFLTGIL